MKGTLEGDGMGERERGDATTRPTTAERTWPPMTFLGWLSGDSGTAYSRTAVAPMLPMARGASWKKAGSSRAKEVERAVMRRNAMNEARNVRRGPSMESGRPSRSNGALNAGLL